MLRKCVRTLQNGFPGLGEAKNEFYHWSRKRFGLLHDPAFAVIANLPRRADDLFLDVGANRGQSILSLRRLRPDAAIVSFEPNPAMVRWLDRHFTGDPRWTLEPVGLGAAADRRTLFTPRYSGFAYDGLATFSAESARAFLSSDTVFGFDPRRLTLDEDVCETRTLDGFGLRPTFIKIDVEGLEHEVLQGGTATIRACEPVLMVERFHRNPALMPLIRSLGYVEVKPVGRTFLVGATAGENMFCMTPRRLTAIQSAAPAADNLPSQTETANAR